MVWFLLRVQEVPGSTPGQPRFFYTQIVENISKQKKYLRFWTIQNVDTKKNIKTSPNVGLEPTTLRLRVSCSTDWASRATNSTAEVSNINAVLASIQSLHSHRLPRQFSKIHGWSSFTVLHRIFHSGHHHFYTNNIPPFTGGQIRHSSLLGARGEDIAVM